jgi:hypothetical protein
VAVPAVAQHIWDNYLKDKPQNALHWIDEGNHYVGTDHADEVANILFSLLN